MSFIKCPICNGTGVDLDAIVTFNQISPKCTVCDGKKIISSLTGKPPSNQQNHVCQSPCYCSGRCKLPPQSLGSENNNNDNTFSGLNYNHQNQKDYFEGE